MFKVFVTSSVPKKILKGLEENFELNYHDSDEGLSEEELMKGAADADAIFCPLSDKITKRVIDAGEKLKIVANYGAGFDNIDLNAAREKDVVVTNAPATNSASSTAELTVALILAAARGIVSGDKLTRAGKFYGWKPNFHLGRQLNGKTLGIIGMGNIGKKVAKIMSAFDMDIIYYNRTRLSEADEAALGLKYMEIDELVEKCDVLTLHTAFSPELKHLINYERIMKMNNNTILVNASRGPIVAEADLIRALNEEKFFGVGLDVYEFEPKYDVELEKFDRVILAPHLGNATFEAREEMGEIALKNLIAVKNGEAAPNKVN